MAVSLQLLSLDADDYRPHPLHAGDRSWTETNCWLDMMIEVLHALDLDPVAASAFTLSTDFEGEQWTLFKFPPEDLRALFGLEVAEMYVWRPAVDHVEEQLALGRLCSVEVDAWYLPDTAGITYHLDHVKTGIVPQLIDREAKRLGYFHNAGYFELEGDDFDGLFYLAGNANPLVLPPYMETIKLDRIRRADDDQLLGTVIALTSDHLARRATTNPIERFRKRLEADLPWLAANGDAAFHPYAFATCRQCGATAELAASFVDWLDERAADGLAAAATHWRSVAVSAKALQFALARVARGRRVDLEASLDEMERGWEAAMRILVERYGE